MQHHGDPDRLVALRLHLPELVVIEFEGRQRVRRRDRDRRSDRRNRRRRGSRRHRPRRLRRLAREDENESKDRQVCLAHDASPLVGVPAIAISLPALVEIKVSAASHLTTKQKRLRVFPFATDFERAKILEPLAVGGLWLRFSP